MEKYEESSPVKQKSDSINIENITNAIDKLSEMEKSIGEVTKDQEEVDSWMFLKKIDLIMALDAIVYRAKIDNKLCDVKMILSSVEYGFRLLMCTQSDCSENAIMWYKSKNDTPAELYCEEHSNFIDSSSEGQHYFESELKKDRKALKSLERLLVVVQEQMEYLIGENSNKDMVAYNKIKEKLEEEYGILKNTLNDMTVKAKQITTKKTKTSKAPKYELLSFVMPDSDKWIKSILGILRLMFEASMKYEIDSKLKAILNWSVGIDQYKEESKSSSVYSVSDEIYGKEFELCKIPTQTLKKIKDLQKRVHKLARAAIAYQNVGISYFSLNDILIL